MEATEENVDTGTPPAKKMKKTADGEVLKSLLETYVECDLLDGSRDDNKRKSLQALYSERAESVIKEW